MPPHLFLVQRLSASHHRPDPLQRRDPPGPGGRLDRGRGQGLARQSRIAHAARGTLDTPEIQTILFGGLKHHPFGASLLLALPETPGAAREWLGKAAQTVTFGDLPDPGSVTLLALSARGLGG